MADPSIRLSGTAALASSSTCTVSITGTPADGELILAVCQDNENPPFASPSIPGFSVIASITSADWNPLYVLGKIASSEGTNPSYTATWAGGAGGLSPCMGIFVIQNAKGSLPTNAATIHDTSSNTSFSIPGITIAAAGSLDFVAVTHDGNTGTGANNYSSWGDSLVEVLEFQDSSNGNYPAFAVAAVNRASTGARSATTVTSGASDKNVAIRIEVEPAASLAYEQEGFRWRNDDGSESAATWAATQDTDITAAAGEARRLRMLTNVSGDAPSEGLKLQYRKAGTSEWKDILRQGL